MKQNIGEIMGLYPTPVTIIGTQTNDKVNWINIAHVGVIGMNTMILSLHESHFSNQAIKENGTLSINLVNEEMMTKADFVGLVSAWKFDKSNVFEYSNGMLEGAPIINESPLSMECEVIDVLEIDHTENFIVKAVNTYVDDNCLTKDGKIDYMKVKPLLFEMPQRRYLSLGKVLGNCWDVGKQLFSKPGSNELKHYQ